MASSVKSRAVVTGPPLTSDCAKHAVLATLAKLGEFPTPHHARVTTVGQAWRVLATTVDAVALLSLCTLGPGGARWSTSIAWFTYLRAPQIWAAQEERATFRMVFVLSCATVFLLCAAYTGLVALEYRERGLQSQSLIVRATVAASKLIQPFVIPLMTTLATPLTCSDVRYYIGADVACGAAEPVVMALASAALLLAWLPLQFVTTLLLVDQDPNSARLTSAVNGRAQTYGFVSRVILVLGPVLLPHVTELWAVVATLGLAYTTFFVFQTLPFYHGVMNRVHCAVSAAATFVCGGSFLTLVADSLAFSSSFSAAWLATATACLAVGLALPTVRYKQLKAKLEAMKDPMLTALAKFHRQAGHAFTVEAASERSLEVTAARVQRPRLSQLGGRANRRGSIEFLAGRVRDARLVQTRMPLGDVAPDNSDDDDNGAGHTEVPVRTVFDGAAPFEVELIVRMLLAQPGSTESRYRARGLGARGATVPTTQAVEQALWLYAAAIEEFRDDHVDLALVKIEYSRFVHCFTADLNMATSALDAAERERPGLEGSFTIFTRQRELARQRAARNNGFVSAEDGDRAAEDYTRRLAASLTLHEDVLKHRSRLYRVMQVRQGTFAADDQSMADRLGAIVESMTEATAKAHTNYADLLRTHPNGVGLSRCYALFCDDVLNDSTQASEYTVSTDGGSISGGSKSGGQSMMSGAQRSTISSTSGTTSMRTLLPRPRTAEVDRIDTRLRIGMVILLLACAAMFATSQTIINIVQSDLSLVKKAGVLQASAVNAVLHTRLLSMHPSVEEITATRKSLTSWKDESELVFKDTFDHSKIGARWFTFNLPMKTWRSDQSSYVENWNLWDATHRLVADVGTVIDDAEQGRLQDPHLHTEWRFVMDNSVTVVAPALEELSQLMENEVFSNNTSYKMYAGLIAAFIGVTLVALGIVFCMALSRVIVINRGVNEVALKLSPMDVSTLLRRTANALANIKKQRATILQALLDDDADRGLGDVQDFTFDADKEGARAGVGSSRRTGGLKSSQRTTTSPSTATGKGGASRPRVSFAPPSEDDSDVESEGVDPQQAGSEALNPLVAPPKPGAPSHLVPVNSRSDLLLEEHGGATSTNPVPLDVFVSPHVVNDSEEVMGGSVESKDSPPPQHSREDMEVDMKASAAGATPRPVTSAHDASHRQGDDEVGSDDDRQQLLTSHGSDGSLLMLPHTSSTASLLASVGVSSNRPLVPALVSPSASAAGKSVPTGGCPVSHAMGGPALVTGGTCPVMKHRMGASGSPGREDQTTTSLVINGARGSHTIDARELPYGLSVESVVAASPGAVVVTDEVGVVKYVNPAFTRLLGYTSEFIVGKNVTTFQPPDIAKKHHLLMKRVVDGGKPKLVGVAGRHVPAIHQDGTMIPVLLGINRVDLPDGMCFVAGLQDARARIAKEAEAEDAKEGTRRRVHKYMALIIRVVLALMFVAALQGLNYGYGSTNLESASTRVAEVNKASWVHAAGVRLAVSAQELAIGDEEVWSMADNLAYLGDTLHTYEHIRNSLRYGNEKLRLAGSAGRDPKLDLLHFGGVLADGTVVHGLDPRMVSFERHVSSIIHRFSRTPREAPLGANYSAIMGDEDLGDIQAAMGGEFNFLLEASIDEYRAQAADKMDSVSSFDIIANIGNAVVVIMLYMFVLKPLMLSLRNTARRTEYMLLGFPEDFAGEGPLKRFFMRANDAIGVGGSV